MSDKIRVLYIDDEDNNLNSFKASLRKDFHIITALNAEEGLAIAEREELHVVIADQRMPGLTGVEFFEQLMLINPDPVRILLTGYSDIASVIDAINKGEVYRFIDKPWNIEQIKNAIKNASEIYFTKKELRDKNERLHKVHSEMNQFVYSLSHELRGPLMSISGVSKLAKMECKDPSILEYFDMIDSATLRLDDFIYKMLDFYRSTKIDNKVSLIKFEEIINQQLVAYKDKWKLEDVNLIVEIQQEEDFYSDDAKIRVILNNLFSNAYKFQKVDAKDKFINLQVTVKDGRALIRIEDNGIGIDQKYHTEVYNLFHRATQRNVGSGLGLYMVKESVIQMGGKIELNSELDEGTVFTIMLPSLTLE
ncbi:hybrid sensor histidine kinase/response regulator [Belliella kenyensis]|uniref:histidine kinase n=1 Tax=Belliella kenyensis TaxID=1472724 RepID=A0ABV8EKQ9_9BACT|nr:hybrid sensor histidine kinase/response regulator [Belliella kenyensis]MCH7403643.1 hybrid sensor histidine kinase/response regulator [Belliella kenyensis]MDN3602204.1 hybrid sensor histidine kinase/response regulator [Belliella kenyensis]